MFLFPHFIDHSCSFRADSVDAEDDSVCLSAWKQFDVEGLVCPPDLWHHRPASDLRKAECEGQEAGTWRPAVCIESFFSSRPDEGWRKEVKQCAVLLCDQPGALQSCTPNSYSQWFSDCLQPSGPITVSTQEVVIHWLQMTHRPCDHVYNTTSSAGFVDSFIMFNLFWHLSINSLWQEGAGLFEKKSHEFLLA